MSNCRIKGCNKIVRVQSRQLCSMHYDRWRKTGDPEGVRPSRWDGYEKPDCGVKDCENKSWSLGYCRTHYLRFKKYGDPTAGVWHKRKKGEGKKWHDDGRGYIWRHDPQSIYAGANGKVYQHRQVMSEILGRPLRDGENVHHKNGKRSDNSPENLELWTVGQPAGQRFKDVALWSMQWLLEGNLETALALHPELKDDVSKLAQVIRTIENG